MTGVAVTGFVVANATVVVAMGRARIRRAIPTNGMRWLLAVLSLPQTERYFQKNDGRMRKNSSSY
jgi:hypothetical protein